MTVRTKVEIAASILAVALVIIGFKSYLAAHDALVEANAKVTAASDEKKQIDAEIADLKAEQRARDAQTAAALDAVQKNFAAAQSPSEIAALVSQIMGLKQPVTLVTPAATASNPNPVAVAQVPVSDADQIKAYAQECEACKVEVPALNAKILNLQQQVKDVTAKDAYDAQIAETWKKAAKGTFWTNTKRASKWLIIGGAAATATVCALGHCK